MRSLVSGLPLLYLKPGEFIIRSEPAAVTTVLGSCVSVTMFSPGFRVGAICHGLLPQCRDSGPCRNECGEGFRYVDCSVLLMIDRFREYGIGGSEIEAKVFGGSDMYDPRVSGGGRATVGSMNIAAAQRILGAENIKIVSSDTGGRQGRKIIFHPHTGDVFLKRVRRAESRQ